MKLPRVFKAWWFHNLIAHPVSEILFWIRCYNASDWIHDESIPEHKSGNGRG